ncbi:MAG TPA: alpha,alpha-trehalase TreA [Flavisolibacter sp.]|nr:alpha,alpha-trehalase TreA [Flavisolibacter sp.]
MRQFPVSLLMLLLGPFTGAQTLSTPDKIYGELFTDVQMGRIFPDNKTFADCIPRRDPKEILKAYRAIKANPGIRFSLRLFIEEHFIIPDSSKSLYETRSQDVAAHINSLWTVLRRQKDSAVEGSSLLPLPYPYIVPGGRFREIYYWDSYFTMLGLKESGEHELIESMISNFAYLINTYGHIPNGNRTYYLSRSQPPFFSLMLDLLAEIKGPSVYALYLPALEKEYSYWMDKSAKTRHVVKMPDGSILNRYFDQLNIPRQESYFEDVQTAARLPPEKRGLLFRNLRSAAESGWDFSSRWMKNGRDLSSIQTISLVPVDLNCLLYHLEKTLSRAYMETGNRVRASYLRQVAQKRKKAINRYCWSPAEGWFTDYDLGAGKPSRSKTLAGMFPFFLSLADSARIVFAAGQLDKVFLKPGGLVTTSQNTGQQWDAPNGWAPLQWISIIGLEKYGEQALAKVVAERWVRLNKKVFASTGKLMEKYNVVDLELEAGGGEYPSQDGFGWTNGVLLALIKKYKLD